MKYELISTSVQIRGKVFRKRDDSVLDDSDFDPKMLDSLYKQGFIKPKSSKAKNPIEASQQYLTEKEEKKPEKEAEKVEETKKVTETKKPKAKKD